MKPVMGRSTPYHLPHSTVPLGYSEIYGGDDRLLNNLFIGAWEPTEQLVAFTEGYDCYLTPEEYKHAMKTTELIGLSRFQNTPQPVWIEQNAYSGEAKPFRAEADAIRADGMAAEITEENGTVVLTLTVPEAVAEAACRPVTTERLGTPRLTEQHYETPEGEDIDFTRDYLNRKREGAVIPGPFTDLTAGTHRIVLWQ